MWELYMPHNMGRKDTAEMNYWDLFHIYEELFRVQAMTVKHLQEELITTI